MMTVTPSILCESSADSGHSMGLSKMHEQAFAWPDLQLYRAAVPSHAGPGLDHKFSRRATR